MACTVFHPQLLTIACTVIAGPATPQAPPAEIDEVKAKLRQMELEVSAEKLYCSAVCEVQQEAFLSTAGPRGDGCGCSWQGVL